MVYYVAVKKRNLRELIEIDFQDITLTGKGLSLCVLLSCKQEGVRKYVCICSFKSKESREGNPETDWLPAQSGRERLEGT